MKKILFCLTLILFVSFNISANASEIAIINLDEVVNNSTAMIKTKKKLDAKKLEVEKKLKAEEKNLADEKTALESQIKILSQEVAQKKVLEFQEKIIAFQNSLKENENNLQKDFMDAYVEITNNIKDIIVEMKQENKEKYNFNVVLPKASVLYNENNLDISADILARLNKRLKEIK